jgi:hypothetical protein
MSAMLALMLLATEPSGGTGAAVSPVTAPSGQVASDAQQDYGPGGVRDQAVPLDWAGPAARVPGADQSVQEFDPAAAVLSDPDMCIVTRGQPIPACAQTDGGGLKLNEDIFAGGISNPDTTCQTVETTRRGSNGQPQRVFATVCGEEAESWSYRSRNTPRSTQNPTRPTQRTVGPNDGVIPENRPSGS